jgi:hypothetical protein
MARLVLALPRWLVAHRANMAASNAVLFRFGRPLLATVALFVALGGCSGSNVITSYTADYRDTVATAGDSQLLLNILRAKDNLPLHFYDLSNIHGSIQWTAAAVANIPVALNGMPTPTTVSPAVGAQNSPSWDFGTTDTQDFTRGILSKLDPRVVKALFDQGVDPRIIMLLFFSAYYEPGGKVLLNTMACDPTDRGQRPEEGCLNQVYAYLDRINRLLWTARSGPVGGWKLRANIYSALQPLGGRLSGDWTLTDTLEQLRELDTTQYRLIGKQLYSVSAQRLAICYERGGTLHSLIPLQHSDQACTQAEVIDRSPPTKSNVGLVLRSAYDIIQFLGQILKFQEEKRLDGKDRCLTLDGRDRRCGTGEVIFQVNAPAGIPVIGTRYGNAWYALHDRGCNKNHQEACDHSIQVLAILELLINENKAAKDIIATPRVQVVP